jgi:hypothetical protein
MAEMALQYLQSAHNKVGHAARAWTGWANALAPEYDVARDNHLNALKEVAEETKVRNEQMWAILGFVLGAVGTAGVATPWAGRLLTKAKRVLEDSGVPAGYDALTSAFVRDALANVAGDAKDAIKDSALDALKTRATGSTSDPYVPTVEKTENWKSRLLESIEFRAKDLEIAANEQVRNQHKWKVQAAKNYEYGMSHDCPFIADQPSQPTDSARGSFRKRAEFEMWVEWGVSLTDEWRTDKSTSIDVWYMGPILRQLQDVGVAQYEVASFAQRGTTIASMRRGYILDLTKVVRWARNERRKRDLVPKLAKQAVEDGIFTVKKNEHVCYPAGNRR